MFTFKFRVGNHTQMLYNPLRRQSALVYENMDLTLLMGPLTAQEALVKELGGNILEDEVIETDD